MKRSYACRFVRTIYGRHRLQVRSVLQRVEYILLAVYQQHMYFVFRVHMSSPVRYQETSVGEVLKASEEFQRFAGNVGIR